MTIQSLKLGGKRFVLVAEKDFRDLQKRAGSTVSTSARRQRSGARDRADVELALKRLSDPNEKRIPYEQVRKQLGLA
jgi:hypothetical protein